MPVSPHDTLANILYVEDASADIMLTRAILDYENVHINLFSTRDGQEALDFLYQKKPFDDVPVPDLVLLDLNIPHTHGTEILRQMKSDEKLKNIAVVILSGSKAPEDIETATRLGAIDYINKPIDKEKLDRIVEKTPCLHWEIQDDANLLYSRC